ncbi:DNA replication and repair protein RecF [Solimonas sp. K1W22B-7]|uniref:DNA replication/repair protein RecF n=1 Tax=Solimonas sp. K1W22B-7 TaxID=2303331 RepID=UPI000E333C61|nr:DNA replication and repair protein RecF [Solimonas sp. K1W22B-7]AXQ27170.1 DNA replication and repair protein RecF [Solimonas sp. K1W22B-7]
MLHLARIGAENFRVFEKLSLRPHRRLNFVYGDNAEGKTTLLELVYVLARGKSFRGSSLQDCAGAAGKHWRLRGRYQQQDDGPLEVVDAGWTQGELAQKREGQAATRLELLREYPVQILEPGLHKLLQDGPSYRRGFLDWGVFHVEQGFHVTWRRFSRALRQRNLALRQRAPDRELEPWTLELATAGEEIQRYRKAQLEAIRPYMDSRVKQLLGTDQWSMDLQAGWAAGQGLKESLDAHLARDRQQGMTQGGPQRAELRLHLHDRQTKTLVSRGQQKQLIAALLLSQCELIYRTTGTAPILLVDDFASELGEEYQQRLLGSLLEYPGQLFITSFAPSGVLEKLPDAAVFHVEQGRLHPVSG